ncbi:MAG: thiolase family protein [Deltaproteobacteria bacterium]|nr:thiolase family protein [Deltaproteobacteria bacterium]
MQGREVFIVSAVRTAVGSFLGIFKDVPAARLGATAIRAALERATLDPKLVDEVYMGCVLTGGMGQAPARQAALFGGIPDSVPCTTVGKVCGSGLQAVILGAKAIALGDCEIVVAGGMESMTQAPFSLPKARQGFRMGKDVVVDLMVNDGLWDVYTDKHMGLCAEQCAQKYKYTREMQDDFAIESYRRSTAAIAAGEFAREIVPFEVAQKKGPPLRMATDEEPGRGNPDKLRTLKPAFDPKNGTITAGNASSINDGAAALALASAEAVKKHGLTPIARIVSYEGAAQASDWFMTAPIPAMQKALRRANWKTTDVDLWEINEAFSVVTMAAMQELKLDPAKVNPRGGAVSLGHPIGASGARVLVTLLHLMEDRKVGRGCTSLCIGGGEALAMTVSR